MKLITKELAAKIPTIKEFHERTKNMQSWADEIVYLHLFFIPGNWDIYLMAHDPESEMAFGWVCLGDPKLAQFGPISLDELRGIKKFGLGVEREIGFKPQPLSEALKGR